MAGVKFADDGGVDDAMLPRPCWRLQFDAFAYAVAQVDYMREHTKVRGGPSLLDAVRLLLALSAPLSRSSCPASCGAA